MHISKLMLMFGTLALAAASAADTYRISLHETATVSGKEIKPGYYKIEVNGDRGVIKDRKKDLVEAPVKVESGKDKFQATTVSYDNSDGKYHLREIHIGGTTVSIVFASLASSN